MGLNNNGLGRPLAHWAVGFLGWAMGHGLFDDPYMEDGFAFILQTCLFKNYSMGSTYEV